MEVVAMALLSWSADSLADIRYMQHTTWEHAHECPANRNGH